MSSTLALRNRRVIWNERARPRRARACAGSVVMSAAVEDDAAAVARELAAELRDERRLAGAVRADQRVHLAGADVEVDVVGRDHAAEALLEAAHLRAAVAPVAAVAHDARGARRAFSRPTMPWRANSTTASSTQPVQNSWCSV